MKAWELLVFEFAQALYLRNCPVPEILEKLTEQMAHDDRYRAPDDLSDAEARDRCESIAYLLWERVDSTAADEPDAEQQDWPEPERIEPAFPPAPPMAAEMLPAVVRPFAVDVAECMGAPLDFSAISTIAAASAALGRVVAIRPKAKD
ncbi:MAG TPA: hypothetical protein VG274_06785, partial [Rhizomicrobium sp.]|nr:hypothetical protein [Rhizomicrobium sp.]